MGERKIEYILFGLLIAAGIFLRIVNLGGLEFYHDETAALTIATGHQPYDLAHALEVSGPIPAGEVLSLQKMDPGLGFEDSMIRLIAADPLTRRSIIFCAGYGSR
jgi:hypothetical protein